MLRGKMIILAILFSSINTISKEIDVVNKINEGKNKINEYISKNGFNYIAKNKWIATIRSEGKERTLLTVEKDKETSGAYGWTGDGPDLIKIENNGSMKAATNTLRINGAKYIDIENNGLIGSIAKNGQGNQSSINVSASEVIYIKNFKDGIIENNNTVENIDSTALVYTSADLFLENEGIIRNFESRTAFGTSNRNFYGLNKKGAIIEAKNGRALSGYTKNGKFKNEGLIKSKNNTAVKMNIKKSNSEKESFIFENSSGIIEGNVDYRIVGGKSTFKNSLGRIKGNIIFNTEDKGELIFDNRSGNINGNLEINSINSNSKLIVDENSRISGNIRAKGNTTLEVSNYIENVGVYLGFSDLILKGDIYTGKISKLEFSDSVGINKNSVLKLNGESLKTTKLTNSGDIIVEKDYEIDGTIENNHKIIYKDTNPKKILKIKKNYSGKGEILFNIDNSGNDILSIDGKASGKTEVYLNNTVTKKFKKNKNGDRAVLLIKTEETKPETFILKNKK